MNRRIRHVALIASFLLLLNAAATSADMACVVPGKGHFRIHVDAGGLFGAFAHDHLIEAENIQGCATIDKTNIVNSSVQISFSSAALRVLDPKEDPNDREKVQKTMETDVLQVTDYPKITFTSTSVKKGTAANLLEVRGNLTIRGRVQPVVLPLTFTESSDGTYRVTGEYTLKQTSFGIKPIKLLGGTVSVKDSLKTEFELFLK